MQTLHVFFIFHNYNLQQPFPHKYKKWKSIFIYCSSLHDQYLRNIQADNTGRMVKIALKILTEQEFASILNSRFNGLLQGGSLDDIDIFRIPNRPLQGSGFLDIISSIGKFVLPAMRKYTAPAASEFAHGVIDDVMQGKNLKKTVRDCGKHGF